MTIAIWHPGVLGRVCALPPPRRERKPIMALKAYVDDSDQAGRVLVMAGFISSAERWSDFSFEWQQRLDMSPRLARFKMSDVDLQSELQMERVRHFYRVIETHVVAQVAVAVNRQELARWVPQMDVPRHLANPYHLAHKAIINLTAQLQRDAGITDRVDFVFDERGEAPHVLGAFANYVATMPDEFTDVTGRPPSFENDEEFLPLQAADLLAWWTRRQWLEEGSISNRYVPYPWQCSNPIPAMVLDLCGDDLRQELESIAERRRVEREPQITMTVRFGGVDFGGEKSS